MKKKERIGAVLSALFVIAYYAAVPLVFAWRPDIPLLGRILLVILPLALAGVMAAVLRQRLRELDGDETDDLNQY